MDYPSADSYSNQCVENCDRSRSYGSLKIASLLELSCLAAIFFPFVGIANGLDVQPFAFLLMLILFFSAPLISSPVKTDIRVLILLFAVVEGFIIAFLIDVAHISLFYMLRIMVAVLTPFLLFVLMAHRKWHLSSKIYVRLVSVYCTVALIQIYLDPYFLSFLVSRTADQIELLVESGRGGRSLTGEPSDFGLTLLAFGVLGWLSKSKEMLAVNRDFSAANLWMLLTLLMNIFLSQSLYSIVLHAVVVYILFLVTKPTWVIPLAIGVFFGVIAFSGYIEFGRISRIMSAFFYDLDWILAQGAMRRALNSINSILVGVEYLPFGYGNGSESVSMAYNFFGYDYTYISSGALFGGVVEYFYRFGLFSIPFLICYFYIIAKIWGAKVTLETKSYRVGMPLAATAIILSFPAGSIANPLMWFAFFSIFFFSTSIQSYR